MFYLLFKCARTGKPRRGVKTTGRRWSGSELKIAGAKRKGKPLCLCHGRLTKQASERRQITGRGGARKGATPVQWEHPIKWSPERAMDLRRDESLGEVKDHRQAVKPVRAQPLHNGNVPIK